MNAVIDKDDPTSRIYLQRTVIFSVAATTLFIVLAIIRTLLWTYGADTGTFAQVIGDSLHGMHNGIEHGTHFRFHWSPALMLLWPVMATTRSALALQIIQVVLTFATAPLLYELFRPYVGARLAGRLGVLALLYPPLDGIAFNEFHELGLLTPVLVGAVLAADRRRWIVFAVLVPIAVGIREDVCVELALIGTALACALRRQRPLQSRAAGLTAILSLVSLGLYYGIVIPHVGAWRPASFYRYPFANGPIQVVVALITRPFVALPAFLNVGRLTYLLESLVPVAFLPLRTLWGTLAIPGFCVILLANTGLVWRMGMHYSALWIAWILIATGFAAVDLVRTHGETVARRWLTVAVSVCALFLIAFNPLHPAHYLQPSYDDIAAAQKTLRCVPESASLSTHDEWFSAIAALRPRATVGVATGVDYLVYADDYPNAEFQLSLEPKVKYALEHGLYRELCSNGHVTAYVRAPTVRRQLRASSAKP